MKRISEIFGDLEMGLEMKMGTNLQGVQKVIETPGDYNVVVKSDEEGDDAGGNAYTSEPRMYRVPDSQ